MTYAGSKREPMRREAAQPEGREPDERPDYQALITKAVEALTRARSFIYERSKLDTDYGMAAETSDELAIINSALSALREGLND